MISNVINYRKFGSLYPGLNLVSSSSPGKNESIATIESY